MTPTPVTPDVSVIIPKYNAEATIGGLLIRILRETRMELLAVNDGSMDATSNVVQSYHDSRLPLLEQPNRSVYAPGTGIFL